MTYALAQTSNGKDEQIPPQPHVDSRLRPEAEIVLLCSRAHLSQEQIDRVSSLLARHIDAEHLFALAYRNGVLPMVCRNLLESLRHEITGEMMERARELSRHQAIRNLSMTGKLLEIVRIFDAAGIASVPFKGPILAMRLYNSTALRQFLDVDILVMPKDFDRAIALLLDGGHEIHSESASRAPGLLRINRRKDVSLIHPGDDYRIELHWKLSGSYFALPLRLQHLWERMDKTILGGLPVSTLPFNDLFVYLCVHAARHGFERLEWICDLNELIASEKDVSWDDVRSHARIHGCERVVELALFLVTDLFGTRLDYPELSRIESDRSLAAIARTIRNRLFSDATSANGIGEWYEYHLMLKEKRRDRVKLHIFYLAWYLKLIFRPNSADKAVFPLPTSFYPLYFILRPARLIYNYLSKQSPTR